MRPRLFWRTGCLAPPAVRVAAKGVLVRAAMAAVAVVAVVAVVVVVAAVVAVVVVVVAEVAAVVAEAGAGPEVLSRVPPAVAILAVQAADCPAPAWAADRVGRRPVACRNLPPVRAPKRAAREVLPLRRLLPAWISVRAATRRSSRCTSCSVPTSGPPSTMQPSRSPAPGPTRHPICRPMP